MAAYAVNGSSWGVWWGLGLERPDPASALPTAIGQIVSSERTPARDNLATGKREAATFRPELVFALGPLVMGEPGEGAYRQLHRDVWAMGWHAQAGLSLYQRQGGVWVVIYPGQAFPDLTATARHISLAFDQSARHVASWEDAGQIIVRQWDQVGQTYVFRGPFAGVDPVLVNDAVAMYFPGDSDVLLLYLNAARTTLHYRAQRDAYLTERTLLTGLTDAVLDQVVALPYRLEVLGESGHVPLAALTPLYPIRTAHFAHASGKMNTGLYEEMLTLRNSADAAFASGRMSGGVFESSQALYALSNVLNASGRLSSGDYFFTLLTATAPPDFLSASGTLVSSSTYANVGIVSSLSNALTATGALIGGSYAP